MVKAKDLSIYEDPSTDAQFILQPEAESSLQKGISVIRQKTWDVADSCQGIIQSTKNAYKTVENTTNDVVAFIKTEEGFYPRAGIIALAGLTGVVLGRKGGIFKKAIYSGALVTAAASICYPYQAVRIAEKEWDWIKSHSTQLLKSSDNQKEEPKEEPSEELKQIPKDIVQVKSEEKSSNDDTNADYGQSKPEDKDLYTTRS
ncbi:MICOS complex subunit Mic27-like [Anneissia japonica]|uniref:MICOS complex subunit Mic27-like n=1 Tax=Anneissia japonica TaxID=1529436 RepID=UPI00142572D0|nr:MICOS complex subunit Mic27-like [Anneissia japonica]XP_033099423.1 MICOS complex subunit Mic27-like [Anneissia japonica]